MSIAEMEDEPYPKGSTSFSHQLKGSLDNLYDIKKKGEHPEYEIEYELIQIAGQHNLGLEECRKIFEAYYRHKLGKELGKVQAIYYRLERVLESISKSLSEMDIFIILEYVAKLSTLSILVGVIVFLSEIPKREEQRSAEIERKQIEQEQKQINKARLRQEAWHVIQEAEGKEYDGGRADALQYLVQDEARLEGINLSKATLSALDLAEMQLALADFRQSSLYGVNLHKARLYGAYLNGADLGVANLHGADLNGADLSPSISKPQDPKNTDLEVRIRALENAPLRSVRNSSIKAKQTKSKPRAPIPSKQPLKIKQSCPKFRFLTNLQKTDLSDANLSGANLTCAVLRGSNLLGANLLNAKLQGLDVENATYNKATKFPKGFYPVNAIDLTIIQSKKSLNGINDAIALRGLNDCSPNLPSLWDLKASFPRVWGLGGQKRQSCVRNLKEINFSGADLRGIRFTNINFENSIFVGANLSRAIFVNKAKSKRPSTLGNANLQGADLSKVDFGGTNLSGADLRHAKLNGADLRFTGKTLNDADLTGAIYDDQTKFPKGFKREESGAYPIKAGIKSLAGFDLQGANLSQIDLTNVDLTKADLRNANLRGTQLKGANLSNSDLTGADLTDANLKDANLHYAKLIKTTLEKTNFAHADLSFADLSKTKITFKQVKSAKNWTKAVYPDRLRRQLLCRDPFDWLLKGCIPMK